MPADRIAPARSTTGDLRSHGRYAYSPITQRPDFTWPGGKRLAVYVALNLEHYAFGEGLVEEIVPALDTHDVLNHSWREYGNRVGAWRLLDLFTKSGVPPSLLVNSDIYRHCSELVSAYRESGAGVVAHGRTNSEAQAGLAEPIERALIDEVTTVLGAREGRAVEGWLGPWIAETANTPDLLDEAGYRYVLDWCFDDQPSWLATRRGRLLAVPYPQELNDSNAIVVRRASAREFTDMIVDQFDEMLAQSTQQPLVMGIALHAYVAGQPFRLRHLRRAFEHIAQHRDRVWLATSGQIARHFSEIEAGR